MGEVYKALDVRLDRTVAIKILPAALADHADARAFGYSRHLFGVSRIAVPQLLPEGEPHRDQTPEPDVKKGLLSREPNSQECQPEGKKGWCRDLDSHDTPPFVQESEFGRAKCPQTRSTSQRPRYAAR